MNRSSSSGETSRRAILEEAIYETSLVKEENGSIMQISHKMAESHEISLPAQYCGEQNPNLNKATTHQYRRG
jgi:hypothetical protein